MQKGSCHSCGAPRSLAFRSALRTIAGPLSIALHPCGNSWNGWESPALGIAFAPIHVHMAQEDIPEAIHAVGDRIALCYAWDWGPTADKFWKDPQEQVPGTGVIDFHAMFHALSEIGYQSPLCIFAHGLEYERTEDGIVALRSRSSPLPAGGTRPRLAVTRPSLGRSAEMPHHWALPQPHSQPLLSSPIHNPCSVGLRGGVICRSC